MASASLAKTSSPSKPYHPMPTLSLDSDDLPAIKSWKVGGKYTILLEVEQIGANKGNQYDTLEPGDTKDTPQSISARFKVLSAKTPNGSFVDAGKKAKIDILKNKAGA